VNETDQAKANTDLLRLLRDVDKIVARQRYLDLMAWLKVIDADMKRMAEDKPTEQRRRERDAGKRIAEILANGVKGAVA